MPELQRLRADHAPAVLAFELANRAYFAAWVSDRGDDFYHEFPERFSALLAEQEAGIGAFHVLVAEDGSVLGRFNLIFAGDATAELGYRVAQSVTGRGVATTTVLELCQLALERYGLRALRAATSRENAASQKVLTRAGFVPIGPADPAHIGGKSGTWYERDLVSDRPRSACDGAIRHGIARLELTHERRELIAGTVQNPEKTLREADGGARVSANEHDEEHYQCPADGPTHAWGPP